MVAFTDAVRRVAEWDAANSGTRSPARGELDARAAVAAAIDRRMEGARMARAFFLLLLALTGTAVMVAGHAAGLRAADLAGVCMVGAGVGLLLEGRRRAHHAALP
jgi:hypothetical protein